MSNSNFCEIHHCGLEYNWDTQDYYCPKCRKEDNQEERDLNIRISDDIDIDDQVG